MERNVNKIDLPNSYKTFVNGIFKTSTVSLIQSDEVNSSAREIRHKTTNILKKKIRKSTSCVIQNDAVNTDSWVCEAKYTNTKKNNNKIGKSTSSLIQNDEVNSDADIIAREARYKNIKTYKNKNSKTSSLIQNDEVNITTDSTAREERYKNIKTYKNKINKNSIHNDKPFNNLTYEENLKLFKKYFFLNPEKLQHSKLKVPFPMSESKEIYIYSDETCPDFSLNSISITNESISVLAANNSKAHNDDLNYKFTADSMLLENLQDNIYDLKKHISYTDKDTSEHNTDLEYRIWDTKTEEPSKKTVADENSLDYKSENADDIIKVSETAAENSPNRSSSPDYFYETYYFVLCPNLNGDKSKPYCINDNFTKELFKNHVISHLHICPDCNKSFNRGVTFRKHILEHSSVNNLNK